MGLFGGITAWNPGGCNVRLQLLFDKIVGQFANMMGTSERYMKVFDLKPDWRYELGGIAVCICRGRLSRLDYGNPADSVSGQITIAVARVSFVNYQN